MSGSIMVFAVLGALILVQTVMSSADGKGKQFKSAEGTAGQAVSGSVVSGDAVSGNSVSGSPDGEKEQPSLHEKKNNKDEKDSEKAEAEASFGMVKEKDSLGEQIAEYAQWLQGVPYVYGGTKLPEETVVHSYIWSEDGDNDIVEDGKLSDVLSDVYGEYGVDCSGLVQGVFGAYGIKLPRSVKDQAEQGREVKVKDIRPGDIIFYGADNEKITHCGIYVGKDKIVHVSARTKVVAVSDMNYRRIARVVRVVGE